MNSSYQSTPSHAKRWFKRKTGFYGPVVICHPSTYFMVGARNFQPSGLNLEVLTDERSYTEITDDEAISLIGKKNSRGTRWSDGVAKAMELCCKFND